MENGPNGIILHDYFRIRGGGERLVGTLSRHMGWPVVAGFKSRRYAEAAAGDADTGDGAGSWIQDVRSLGCFQGVAPLQIMSLIRGFRDRAGPFIRGHDPVLYSGTYAPLAVLGSPARRNLYYCHSPARFVYDQREFYLSVLPFWQRPLLQWLIRRVRPLYEQALPMMDTIVANSENVRQRLLRYLGLDALVVHPPCDTDRFCWLGQSNFYLSTARLDPLKRVDLVVEAFRKMPDKKLVVASGGAGEKTIRRAAAGADNITVLGWVPEKRLQELMGTCIATVYIPRDEDFGISPVESMAAGKPVIGVQEGGVPETVGNTEGSGSLVETPCGMLLKRRPCTEDLIRAVQRMDPQKARTMREACERRAGQFDTRVFLRKMGCIAGSGVTAPESADCIS